MGVELSSIHGAPKARAKNAFFKQGTGVDLIGIHEAPKARAKNAFSKQGTGVELIGIHEAPKARSSTAQGEGACDSALRNPGSGWENIKKP